MLRTHFFAKMQLCLLAASSIPALALAGGADVPLKNHVWPFETDKNWDKDKLYRGYTVATQVCLACHSFQYVTHRDLTRAKFTLEEAKYLARVVEIDVNAPIISGLTDEDAEGSYGKPVPDLSLINKARSGLADYTYALLMGYADEADPVKRVKVRNDFPDGLPEGAHYNDVFPGHAIAMPNPLAMDDLVEYHDGTSATVDQMAKDVTYFLQWTAEPERFERHKLGVFVLLYLLIFTLLAYWVNKLTWRNVKE